jgi:protein-S-isoprenylcysteine O-methyltransferase Ste14/rhodanese-related sulfurtransferase
MGKLMSVSDWIAESKILTMIFFALCAGVIIAAVLDPAAGSAQPSAVQIVLAVILFVVAGVLLFPALIGVVSYFAFLPSIFRDGHVFARVYADHLLHPVSTAFLVGLPGVCILTWSKTALALWGASLIVYAVQTALLLLRMRRETLENGSDAQGSGIGAFLLNLIVGGELVTIASGARPLHAWKLNYLPDDTWIVDVRTGPEFRWNRMEGGENYPWGVGLIEAAQTRSKDAPVLVTCLSGHRGPAVAAIIRRLGFKRVYNLNWGILYLMLHSDPSGVKGPFRLTRGRVAADNGPEPLKSMTHLQLACIFGAIGAPLAQTALFPKPLSLALILIGGTLSFLGLAMIAAGQITLGKNFRFYVSPKEDGELVTRGIYGLVRHPIYGGSFLSLTGLALTLGAWSGAPFVAACSICFLVKGAREEKLLAAKFPGFGDYAAITWRYLPYVY